MSRNSAGRKAASVSTNKSQFVDKLSTNKAYLSLILVSLHFTILVDSFHGKNGYDYMATKVCIDILLTISHIMKIFGNLFN